MLQDGMPAVRTAALGTQVVLHTRLAEGVSTLQQQWYAAASIVHRCAHTTFEGHVAALHNWLCTAKSSCAAAAPLGDAKPSDLELHSSRSIK
jgi:hypothetical protein